MSKFFVLYDGRARIEGTEEATVLTTANSAEEARAERADGIVDGFLYYEESIWAEYDLHGKKLVNEVMREDLSPLKGE